MISVWWYIASQHTALLRCVPTHPARHETPLELSNARKCRDVGRLECASRVLHDRGKFFFVRGAWSARAKYRDGRNSRHRYIFAFWFFIEDAV